VTNESEDMQCVSVMRTSRGAYYAWWGNGSREMNWFDPDKGIPAGAEEDYLSRTHKGDCGLV